MNKRYKLSAFLIFFIIIGVFFSVNKIKYFDINVENNIVKEIIILLVFIDIIFLWIFTKKYNKNTIHTIDKVCEEFKDIVEGLDFSRRIIYKDRKLDRLVVNLNQQLDLIENYLYKWKERENKYIEINKKLKELDKVKTDFLSTVSHELRTPLTSILGFAKISKKKIIKFKSGLINECNSEVEESFMKLMDKVLDNNEIIIFEGERLTNIINNLLDITKMEAGAVDWKKENIDISEVINKAILSCYSLIENKSIEIHDDIEENLPLVVGDKDKIMQVIVNLISNAIKFTNEGTILCKVRKNENELHISVTDTGIGIDEINYGVIFERFKQVGDTLINKPNGTGLGLSICKTIVEQHKGRIWVESQVKVGSKFTFTLPIKEVNK